MAKECKIVVVDDHTLFRNGLRTLLDGIEGFSVIGEASNGVELLELLPGIEPDVILLDIEMPKMNGIVTAEEALKRYPDLKIITLSMYGDEDYYFKMVSLGVKGFILKNSEIKEVAAAIETVVGGGSYFSQELLFNLVSNLKSTPRRFRKTVQRSFRNGNPKFCCTSAGVNRTVKSPIRCLSPNVRSISTVPTSSLKPAAKIRLTWSFMRSRTIWSRSDPGE